MESKVVSHRVFYGFLDLKKQFKGGFPPGSVCCVCYLDWQLGVSSRNPLPIRSKHQEGIVLLAEIEHQEGCLYMGTHIYICIYKQLPKRLPTPIREEILLHFQLSVSVAIEAPPCLLQLLCLGKLKKLMMVCWVNLKKYEMLRPRQVWHSNGKSTMFTIFTWKNRDFPLL